MNACASQQSGNFWVQCARLSAADLAYDMALSCLARKGRGFGRSTRKCSTRRQLLVFLYIDGGLSCFQRLYKKIESASVFMRAGQIAKVVFLAFRSFFQQEVDEAHRGLPNVRILGLINSAYLRCPVLMYASFESQVSNLSVKLYHH